MRRRRLADAAVVAELRAAPPRDQLLAVRGSCSVSSRSSTGYE
jgi:hypothetical protein